MAKNAACPRLTWPARPMSRLSPIAGSAKIIANTTILSAEAVATNGVMIITPTRMTQPMTVPWLFAQKPPAGFMVPTKVGVVGFVISLHPDRCWLEDQAPGAEHENQDQDDERDAILQPGCDVSGDIHLEHTEEQCADDGRPEGGESAEHCRDEPFQAEQQSTRPDGQVD